MSRLRLIGATAASAPPGGHYSHAVVAGGFVYVSGQLPVRPDGTRDPSLSFAEQSRLALANLRAALEADVVIYSVIIVPIPGESGRNTGGEHALITLADGTGGRSFQPRAASDLDPVFRDIEAELRTQYVLGFYPRPVRGAKPYRRLEVRALNPFFTVQARKGYYFREPLP